MENFDFVVMLIVQCKILQIINISSKAMECRTIDLISAHELLQTAAQNIAELRTSFYAIIKETFGIVSKWGFPKRFLNKRVQKTKTYFDEKSEGISLSDPKKRFRVIVFLPMMNILFCQLINYFEERKSVVTTYQVLEPSFPSSASHLNIEIEAKNFLTNLLITLPSLSYAKCFQSNRR